jgi:hypothetical protein
MISGRTIVAIRYDSAGNAVTVAANASELTLGEGDKEGEKFRPSVASLVRWCEGEKVEPRTEEPLSSWTPVTCGGEEAFADHPRGEPAPAEDTTILVPRAGNPLVVVTSDPTSACEDAARLNAEWGA